MLYCVQENNFKAVLESIRDLMNEDTIIPDWLTNIFLGYGDPAGAQYTSIVEENPEAFISKVDFKDTFLDSQHLIESFPGEAIDSLVDQTYFSSCSLEFPSADPSQSPISPAKKNHPRGEIDFIYRELHPACINLHWQLAISLLRKVDKCLSICFIPNQVKFSCKEQKEVCSLMRTKHSYCPADYDVEIHNNSGGPKATRPFRITFPPLPKKAVQQKGKKRKAEDGPLEKDAEQPSSARPRLVAESYAPQDPGPYPQDKPPENPVRFTPVQVRFWGCPGCST